MRKPRLLLPFLALGCLLVLTWSWLLAQDPDLQNASAHSAKSALAPRGKLLARRNPIVELVERCKGSVVNIHSERMVQGPMNQDAFAAASTQSRVNGMGTGIVIDQRGYVVTNYHVIEDVNSLRVKLADGSSCAGEVIARSKEQDLALVKIDCRQSLPVMPLGTAQDLMVGESVVAIGNAYGYEHTVSYGIVSAIKRDVTLNKDISYKSLIQTDASINPGNSGGPLLNVNGELVGINVAIRQGAQGIGFAIPVDTMIRTVAEMLRGRRRQIAYDGLAVRDQLETTGEGMARTVIVDRVDPGSPAAQANLLPGDELIRLGDLAIHCSFDLERALIDRNPKDAIALVVRRNQQDVKTDLVLQHADSTKAGVAEMIWRKLGVRLTPVGADSVSRTDSRLRGGMEVVQINPNGASARAGIKRGDVLVGLHQWETLSFDNVAYVLNHPDLNTRLMPLAYYVVRANKMNPGLFQQMD
jgi:serine protease Do